MYREIPHIFHKIDITLYQVSGPELHPTLSSNMNRDSPFGIPPLRDPLPLKSDGQPDLVQRVIKVRRAVGWQ